MSKAEEMLRLIRCYKDESGETEIDMHKVVDFAIKKGWPLPKPKDPREILLAQFSDTARQEIRRDEKTGHPYRANHAVPRYNANGQQVFYWIDIDDPKTTPASFRKSAVMRREQMVDDGLQLSFDLDRWNSRHPNEADQVNLPWDFTMDIELRRASYDDSKGDKAA